MLRALTAIGAIFAMAGIANANCIGSSTYSTCYDYQSGNSYSVQRSGNMTTTYGNNSRTGSSWSQTDNQIGGSTFSSGRASNGNSWNSTTQDLGGYSIRSGRDSRGNSFSTTCGPFGCN